MTIFLTLSNLQHNGEMHKAGSLFEANLSEFEALVQDKVLRVVEGAESVQQAQEILAEEAEVENETATEPEKTEENTWGPQPDNTDAVIPETPVTPAPEKSEDENKPGILGRIFGGDKQENKPAEDLSKNL